MFLDDHEGFLAVDMIWLPPHPRSRQQVVCLSQSSRASPIEITDGRGGERGGGGAKHYGEKAWSSLNHSILADFLDWLLFMS